MSHEVQDEKECATEQFACDRQLYTEVGQLEKQEQNDSTTLCRPKSTTLHFY